MLEDSSPWVELSSPGVEGLFHAVECLTLGIVRNPVGACSVLAVIIPVQGLGGPQRTPLLINSMDITDSRGMGIAVGLVKTASGWGVDWRSHEKWVCCLIGHL